MADDPNHRQHGIETKGLTSKEAARLQVLTPEDSYALKDRSEMSTRAIVYEMFEDPTSSTSAMVIMMVINAMIMTSTVTFIIETMPSLEDVDENIWFTIETICIVGFTLDFAVRVSCCPSLGEFWRDTMNWIDFIAIVPYYIELVFNLLEVKGSGIANLRVIRVLRLVRILRIMNQNGGNMTAVIGTIISSSSAALSIPLFFLGLSVVIFASVMYYAEVGAPVTCYGPGLHLHGEKWETTYGNSGYCDADAAEKLKKIHPNATYTCDPFDGEHMHASIVHLGKPVTHGADCCYCLPNKLYTDVNHFVSITDGFWWAGMTFTTVGYGDKFPRTWGGRIIAVITMFVGVFFVSMPLTIVGTSFNAAYEGVELEKLQKLNKVLLKGDSDQPKDQLILLEKYYAFVSKLVALETAVLGKDEHEKLTMRRECKEFMPGLKRTCEEFESAMCDALHIVRLPPEMRKKVLLDDSDED